MIGRTQFVTLVLCFLVARAAWAAEARTVYDVVDHRIAASAQKLSLSEIGQDIVRAGIKRRWVFEEIAPGQLKATQTSGKRHATVNVTYSQTSYSITLAESTGMGQQGRQIAGNYHIWVSNLTKDIDGELASASRAGGGSR